MRARAMQRLDVLRRIDPALRDDHPPLRNQGAEPRRERYVHLECPQVAVVDADDFGAGAQRRLQLALVVGFDEALQP